MPIDLKWIQNHPEQVQEWQTLRALDTEKSIVLWNDVLIPLDRQVREINHDIQSKRRRLNQILKELRHVDDDDEKSLLLRDSLLEERQELSNRIAGQEQQLTSTRRTLHRALWTLGSPVDASFTKIQKLETYSNSVYKEQQPRTTTKEKKDVIIVIEPAQEANFDFSCNVGWQWSWAMTNFVYQFFLGRKYTYIHTLSLHRQLETWHRNHLDLLHAMWGCNSHRSSSGCAICNMSCEEEEQQQPLPNITTTTTTTTSTADCYDDVSSQRKVHSPPPPAWLAWIAQSIPRKSIFGAKQLPRYTLLRGTTTCTPNQSVPTRTTTTTSPPPPPPPEQETIELLAMTAGTIWDSRQVQMELAGDLLALYQSLLVQDNDDDDDATTVTLSLQVIPASSLELHEQSRVVVVATKSSSTSTKNVTNTKSTTKQQQQQHYPLGWVSNFGDSASRACGLYFKGGGLQDSKDFVHLVHATIVGPNTRTNIIQCNTRVCQEQKIVLIPSCMLLDQGGLLNMAVVDKPNLSKYASLPVQAFLKSSKMKKDHAPLGPATCDSLRQTVAPTEPQEIGIRKPKFPMLRPTTFTQLHRATEAISCPFGFLLNP